MTGALVRPRGYSESIPLVRPGTSAWLHPISQVPMNTAFITAGRLYNQILRWTPRSLVTLLELLFPVPPYCRRPICFSSHNRPGAHVSVVSRFGVWPSYLVNTLFWPQEGSAQHHV